MEEENKIAFVAGIVKPKIEILKNNKTIAHCTSETTAYQFLKNTYIPAITRNKIRCMINGHMPTPRSIRMIDNYSGAILYNEDEFIVRRIAGGHRDRHAHRPRSHA